MFLTSAALNKALALEIIAMQTPTRHSPAVERFLRKASTQRRSLALVTGN